MLVPFVYLLWKTCTYAFCPLWNWLLLLVRFCVCLVCVFEAASPVAHAGLHDAETTWVLILPAFTSQALGLHMCAALSGLVVAYCWIVRIIYIFCIEISLSDVCCSNLANILPILINSFSHFPNLFFEPQSFHSDEIHDAPFICF